MKFEIPAAVQAELDARDAAEEKKQKEQLESGVIQLKFPWGNEKRGVPSSILRSALFGVVRRGRRNIWNVSKSQHGVITLFDIQAQSLCNLTKTYGWHVLKRASVRGVQK